MLEHVTAALIAGGKSKRFGSPKQKALYNGRSLLELAIQKIVRISSDAIIVGDVQHSQLKKPLPIHDDLERECGPIGGIYTAMHFSKKRWVAIFPVDMPLLPISVYRFLYVSSRAGLPIVAKSDRGVEPLVSLWPIETLVLVKNQIEKKDFRLYYLLKLLNAIELDLSKIPGYNHLWFKNINYKRDLQTLESNMDHYGFSELENEELKL